MGTSVARERTAQLRTERMLEAAIGLFCEKGIEETSIEDVAKRAQVGPATVYRYFDTKAELAVRSAKEYWKQVSDKYLRLLMTSAYREADGYGQLAQIIGVFRTIFEQEFSFLKFLQEFDVFVRKYEIPRERLAEYEAAILDLKPFVTDALERGLGDGSLEFPWTVDEVYFSVTHTLLALMQKLAFNGSMLYSDDRVGMGLQVQLAGEMVLRGLKGRN